jgi:hypothetical protein
MEYRYSTGLAGLFFGGLAFLFGLLLFSGGGLALALAVLAVFSSIVGSMGFLADPTGFLHAMGKRLIVTDEQLQEVDEKSRIVWMLRPEEVSRVEEEPGRRVFPAGVADAWRSETWTVELRSGYRVRIPVWLLPGRGARFKQRFESFLHPPARQQSSSAA